MGWNDYIEEDCMIPSPDNPELYAAWLAKQRRILNGEDNAEDYPFDDFDSLLEADDE